MSIVVHALSAGDQANWRQLWTEYLEFYETEVSEAVYQSTFERLTCTDQPCFSGYLAFINGAAVGLVQSVYHPTLWQIGDVCYLHDLYTVPNARGKGVARTLIETVCREAAARGVDRVYWLTHENNAVARRLYDKVAVRSGLIEYSRE